MRSKSSLTDQWAISVPYSMFPGLVLSLHTKFSHLSKQQLTALLSRYYYCPGYQNIIDEVTNACRHCLTIRTLPKVITKFETTSPGDFGTRFSIDVLERCQQRLLVTVEDGSNFTMVESIEDQKADTIRPAILAQILPLILMTGATIRSDNGPSLQTLKIKSEREDSVWYRYLVQPQMGAWCDIQCQQKPYL